MTPSRSWTKWRTFSPLFMLVVLSLFVMPSPLHALMETPGSFADLAERLGPSVVNVYTTQVVKAPKLQQLFFESEILP